MSYKFERLEAWQLALDYSDRIYQLSSNLPRDEEYNLKSQIRRAATSIALNIAEGSTTQSDAEQRRFVGIAIRSLVETVACMHLINRHCRPENVQMIRDAYSDSQKLFAKLQAFQHALSNSSVREDTLNMKSITSFSSSHMIRCLVSGGGQRSAVSGQRQL